MKSKAKIVSLGSLRKSVSRLRKRGKKIAFTNGCFDILHYGHINYLEKASRQGRVLIVGLNSDNSVRKIKGPLRPIVPQQERAAVLAALACVDFVTIFKEPTPLNLIKAVKPDVLIKGADWKGKEVVGAGLVRSRGGRVELIKYVQGKSTTNIIKAVLKKCAAKTKKRSTA